jgi:D-alanyl-D-alanine dipeptidase
MKYIRNYFFMLCLLFGSMISQAQDKHWMDVHSLDSSIVLDLRYATTNNFVQEKLYECGRCYLRTEVAEALVKVHQDLKQQGYGGLKMYDCYRPRSVQWKLWNKVPNPRYVADPRKGSMHNRGSAVDLTIIDRNGQELSMGTAYDFFGEEAHYDYTKHPEDVLKNRRLLREAMSKHGFNGIRTEWWHFSYGLKSYNLSDFQWKCP